jgi:hypothetical protein
LSIALAVIIAAIGIGYAMSRITKMRRELPEFAEKEAKPKRQSKREKRLEQIRAAEPVYVAPSIDDLVAAEIADTHVDEIPGGEGLTSAVMLKVFHRDTAVAETCLPGDRRFVIAAGVEPADADVEDVKLICEGHSAEPLGSNDGEEAAPPEE